MPAHRRALRWANVGREHTPGGCEILLLSPVYRGGIGVLQILLAEDNEGDVLLVEQALAEHQIDHELHVAKDGDEALKYVADMGSGDGPPCPDVLLLDLN